MKKSKLVLAVLLFVLAATSSFAAKKSKSANHKFKDSATQKSFSLAADFVRAKITAEKEGKSDFLVAEDLLIEKAFQDGKVPPADATNATEKKDLPLESDKKLSEESLEQSAPSQNALTEKNLKALTLMGFSLVDSILQSPKAPKKESTPLPPSLFLACLESLENNTQLPKVISDSFTPTPKSAQDSAFLSASAKGLETGEGAQNFAEGESDKSAKDLGDKTSEGESGNKAKVASNKAVGDKVNDAVGESPLGAVEGAGTLSENEGLEGKNEAGALYVLALVGTLGKIEAQYANFEIKEKDTFPNLKALEIEVSEAPSKDNTLENDKTSGNNGEGDKSEVEKGAESLSEGEKGTGSLSEAALSGEEGDKKSDGNGEISENSGDGAKTKSSSKKKKRDKKSSKKSSDKSGAATASDKIDSAASSKLSDEYKGSKEVLSFAIAHPAISKSTGVELKSVVIKSAKSKKGESGFEIAMTKREVFEDFLNKSVSDTDFLVYEKNAKSALLPQLEAFFNAQKMLEGCANSSSEVLKMAKKAALATIERAKKNQIVTFSNPKGVASSFFTGAIKLPEGDYKVELLYSNGACDKKTVKIKAGETVVVKSALVE